MGTKLKWSRELARIHQHEREPRVLFTTVHGQVVVKEGDNMGEQGMSIGLLMESTRRGNQPKHMFWHGQLVRVKPEHGDVLNETDEHLFHAYTRLFAWPVISFTVRRV